MKYATYEDAKTYLSLADFELTSRGMTMPIDRTVKMLMAEKIANRDGITLDEKNVTSKEVSVEEIIPAKLREFLFEKNAF